MRFGVYFLTSIFVLSSCNKGDGITKVCPGTLQQGANERFNYTPPPGTGYSSPTAIFRRKAVEFLKWSKGKILVIGSDPQQYADPLVSNRLVTLSNSKGLLSRKFFSSTPSRLGQVLNESGIGFIIYTPLSASADSIRRVDAARQDGWFHPLLIGKGGNFLFRVGPDSRLDRQDIKRIIAYTWNLANGRTPAEPDIDQLAEQCSPGMCMAFVSLFSMQPVAGKPRLEARAGGMGDTLLNALVRAAKKISIGAMSGAPGKYNAMVRDRFRIVLELGSSAALVLDKDASRLNTFINPGLHTVVLRDMQKGSNIRLQTPLGSFRNHTETVRRELDRICISGGLGRDSWMDENFELWFLPTRIFLEKLPGGSVMELTRLAPSQDDIDISPRAIAGAIEAGLGYLERNRTRDNGYLYRLDPVRPVWRLKHDMGLRALVTFCALEAALTVDGLENHPFFTKALYSLISNRFCVLGSKGRLACSVRGKGRGSMSHDPMERDRIIEGTAGTLLSLLLIKEKNGLMPVLQSAPIELGRFLLEELAREGIGMNASKLRLSTQGLALLALARLVHSGSTGEDILETTSRLVEARINWLKKKRKTAMDRDSARSILYLAPWVMMAAMELKGLPGGGRETLEDVLDLEAIQSACCKVTVSRGASIEQAGGFAFPPVYSPTLDCGPNVAVLAIAMEAALSAAPFKMDAIHRSLDQALRFVLGLQYRDPGMASLLDESWLATGGFRIDYSIPVIRSRETGLALLALAESYKVLRELPQGDSLGAGKQVK
ncbi:MAG: hypothetical protein GXP49_01335 [Deltaproteobacteria bacterium]|nr:hypothetical protein [Deltaproteobacteria bacterium]